MSDTGLEEDEGKSNVIDVDEAKGLFSDSTFVESMSEDKGQEENVEIENGFGNVVMNEKSTLKVQEVEKESSSVTDREIVVACPADFSVLEKCSRRTMATNCTPCAMATNCTPCAMAHRGARLAPWRIEVRAFASRVPSDLFLSSSQSAIVRDAERKDTHRGKKETQRCGRKETQRCGRKETQRCGRTEQREEGRRRREKKDRAERRRGEKDRAERRCRREEKFFLKNCSVTVSKRIVLHGPALISSDDKLIWKGEVN